MVLTKSINNFFILIFFYRKYHPGHRTDEPVEIHSLGSKITIYEVLF